MHQSDFGWSSAPDPAGEAHSAPQTFNWILGGPTFKGREEGEKGRAREERRGVKGRGQERKG